MSALAGDCGLITARTPPPNRASPASNFKNRVRLGLVERFGAVPDSSPKFFRIVDFEKLQHYRDRRPPWIKLHVELWDDERFFELTPGERYMLIGLFIVASKNGNRMKMSQSWLQSQLLTTTRIPLEKFMDMGWIEPLEQNASKTLDASAVLASRKQNAMPETETETEGETETEESVNNSNLPTVVPAEKPAGPRDEAADRFSELYQQNLGVPYGWQPGDFPGFAKLRKRLKIGTRETPEGWEETCGNYFQTPRRRWTLQDLFSNYDSLRLSPLDRFGIPVNHSGANGNGHKTREQRNLEASRRVSAQLGLEDLDSV